MMSHMGSPSLASRSLAVDCRLGTRGIRSAILTYLSQIVIRAFSSHAKIAGESVCRCTEAASALSLGDRRITGVVIGRKAFGRTRTTGAGCLHRALGGASRRSVMAERPYD